MSHPANSDVVNSAPRVAFDLEILADGSSPKSSNFENLVGNMTDDDKIFLVFKDILKLPDDIDRATLRYNETKGWDSIGHMSLVAGLEDSFDCMLDTDDILDMSSFDKASEIMEKYRGNSA